MTIDQEQLEDKLEHARANYWILTLFCGIFLALVINRIIQSEYDGITVIYGTLLATIGYFAIKLSHLIQQLKAQRE